jgi:HK97 family phage major capsid protein
MAFNSLIDRTGAQALIPEDVSREIIQNVPDMSAVMQLARRLPNMSRNQRRLPVLSGLITAYFVSGDTGLKQASNASWTDKFINAEELAVIVPIPEAVLDDADYDIWGEVRPRIEEAFGAAFDRAVLFGTNAPSDWPDDLLAGATSASNTVTLGAGADIYDDIMSDGGVIAKVEEDGFMVNGHVAAVSMRSKLRGLRDANGNPIFVRVVQEGSQYELDGAPMFFPPSDPTYGAFDAAQALMFSGDWNQLVWSVRQDVTYKLLDQAVIQDGAGNIVHNLAQQDMVALRAVIRLGWQLPNPINRQQTTEASRYPFGVLLPT